MREIEIRTALQKELQAEGKQKEKANKMQRTTLRGETAYVESPKANVNLENSPHSNMNRRRNEKGRDELVYLLQKAHRTEIRKVTESVLTEVQKGAHQNLLVKVRQGKRTDHLEKTSDEEVVKRKFL